MKQEIQCEQAGEKQWEAAERTMSDFKRLASRYASAAWDARQPGIRALYRQLLQHTLDDQDKLYRLLAARVDEKKVRSASGEDVQQEIASHDRALSELEAAIRKDFSGMEAKEAHREEPVGEALYEAEEETAVLEPPIEYEEKELEIFGERPDYYSSLSASSAYDSSYRGVYQSETSVPEEEDSVSAETVETGVGGPATPAAPAQPTAATPESFAPVQGAPSRFGGSPAPAASEQPAYATPAPPAAATPENSALVQGAPSRFGGGPASAAPEQPAYATPTAATPESSIPVQGAPSRFGGSPAPAAPEQPAYATPTAATPESSALVQGAPSRFGGNPAPAAPAQPYAAPRSPYGRPATSGAASYGMPAGAATPAAYGQPASPSGVPVGASYVGFRSPAPAHAPYGSRPLPQQGQPGPGSYSAGQPQRYGQPYAGGQSQPGSPTPPAAPSAQQHYPSRYRGEGSDRPPAYRPQG